MTTTYTSSLQRNTLRLTDVSTGYNVALGYNAGGRLHTVTGNGVSAAYALPAQFAADW